MNGLFGFTSGTWHFLHGAWIGAFKRQFQFHRPSAEFIGRSSADRRARSRRALARRADDVTTLLEEIQQADTVIPSMTVSGASKPPLDFVHFRGARLLTAKSPEAVTIKVDDDVVLWLSQQDSGYQEQVNQLLRQQMSRTRG